MAFAASAREFDVILGPSRSGKSILLNLIGALDTPTSGEAWFLDHQLRNASKAALIRSQDQPINRSRPRMPAAGLSQ